MARPYLWHPTALLSATILCATIVAGQRLGDNPCQDYSLHDCDKNAVCKSNQPGYFECQCPSGFVDLSPDRRFPGRVCKTEENECRLGTHRCDPNAECIDTKEAYSCRCKPGWIDTSPDLVGAPGRVCGKGDQCAAFNCSSDADCRESPSGAVCQCRIGFADVSQQQGLPNGRVCKKLVNECTEKKHDCSSNANCIDTSDAFTCRCADGYRDESPDALSRPGRVCVQSSVPDPPECDVNDPLSCDQRKAEVCVFVEGTYKCKCPAGYSRLPDGRCLVINECAEARLNDCGTNAQCADQAEGFTCQCQPGFADVSPNITSKPGRICRQRVNECTDATRYGVDCHSNAVCVDTDEAYTCRCRPGFADVSENYNRLPGRRCVEAINECADSASNDCAQQAVCEDAKEGYTCRCRPGFVDASSNITHYPGRVCNKPKGPEEIGGPTSLPQLEECDVKNPRCKANEVCIDKDNKGTTLCECAPNAFRFEDGSCRLYICRCKPGFVDFSPNPSRFGGVVCQEVVNECANPSLNTCHKDALCIDTTESYKCVCKAGFIDMDELRNPGRNCQKMHENDHCSPGNNDCDRNARCTPRGDSDFECACPAGYRDKSPNPSQRPGRVCIPLIPECDNPSLNDCDAPDRAICTDTDDGYLCRCRQGFLDISPDPAQKPGRLCKPLENECLKGVADCAKDGGICEDTPDSYTCRCAINYLDVSLDRQTRPGRQCKRLVNECTTGQNDCSPQATCTDTEDSFVCACPGDFIDVSPDPARRPGRRCLRRINECKENKHDCSPNADCVDTPESFRCKCRNDFVDESPDQQNRPGRVCRPQLVDECRLGTHDCSKHATCIDQPSGFTCQCNAEFLDDSPNRITRPGRVCVAKPTPPPEECRVDLETSCKVALNEVCRLVDGVPKCACPINYSRDPTSNACTVVNECQFPQLNDCDPNAECIDQPIGYNCRCKAGFKDRSADQLARPGRNCQPLVNECQFPHLNDCHQNANCTDLEEGYQCKCQEGFEDRSPSRPGRVCQQKVNECENPALNSCDPNADCIDEQQGYKCKCRAGFFDVSPSPNLQGRGCRQIVDECKSPNLNDCHQSAVCTDTLDSYTCACPANSRDISPNPSFPGRVCLLFENECLSGKHDCDPNAICRDNEESFTCECASGYTDRSPNKLSRPGRVCVQLIDECATARHTCSPQAECRDLEEGYTCECKDGFVDRSPDLLTQPGRVCGVPEVCPTNHLCSSAAVCEPLGGAEYRCTCIQGYVDQSTDANGCLNPRLNDCSPDAQCTNGRRLGEYSCRCLPGFQDGADKPGRVCIAVTDDRRRKPSSSLVRQPSQTAWSSFAFAPSVTDNECRDPRLNNCSRNAICYDEPRGYRCECSRGYVDRSPEPQFAGRVCEPPASATPSPRHPCQDPLLNDCHPAGTCKPQGASYTCECLQGYVDRSPDVQTKPGRVCVLTQPICLDPVQNDCHPAAICSETSGPEKYTCRCRDGYVDESPDTNRPGRLCVEQVNECLDRALNDCDPIAVCEDRPKGYTCRCPVESKDQSPDPQRPGRRCFKQLDECRNPLMNNCSRFADCIDREDGYECKCRAGYHDENPTHAGTVCNYIINECESTNLNDCDRHADCINLPGGYSCQCRQPYLDESPDKQNQPGRICRFNECNDPNYNKCARDAVCQDTEDGFVCHCKEGFYDNSPNPLEPGRVCIGFNIESTTLRDPVTIPADAVRCGPINLCYVSRNEVCIGGQHCGCRPGQNRRDSSQACVDVDTIVLAFRIMHQGNEPLMYSSQFGQPSSARYVQIVDEFRKGMHQAVGGTAYAPRYVTTDVNFITHPKTVNSSWPDGLLFNFTVATEMAVATSDSYDSASETSSDYTMREEIERRVTTDVTKSETRKTVTADVHGHATAQFHVYPPIDANTSRKGGGRFGGLAGVKKEVTKRWNRMASDTATSSKTHREEMHHSEADKDESTVYESGRFAGASDMFSATASERDRGQSIAEFSVGNLQARESEWGETGTEFSQNREMSEYTEREDTGSEASHSLTDAPEDDMYDKKVLVKKTQGYQPDASGQGGTERYTTEVSTKTQMRETTRR
uniref:EGF-like domain-containing protein n=1 Tax=Plectus sambesii TaxID=2011161 RepID=A0A914WTS8_9BILA